MRNAIYLLSLLLCSAGFVFSQSESIRSTVSVVGEANTTVSPDQVVFTFEVVTTDKEVGPAKQANDERSSRTLAAVKAFKIKVEDVQTDSLTIAPKYSLYHTLLGYEVTKRILVTLKDLDKIDDFVSKVIDAGVNRVVNISIENSQLQKHQEEIRAKTVKNAEDKAKLYAKQLSQTVGKAYVIREEMADYPYSTGYGSGYGTGDGNGNGDEPTNATLAAPTAYDRMITFSIGKIKVEEKIYVMFELMR